MQFSSDYLKNRKSFFDSSGVPIPPDWQKMNTDQHPVQFGPGDEFETWDSNYLSGHKVELYDKVVQESGNIETVPVIDLEFPRYEEFCAAAKEHHSDLWKYQERLRERAREEFKVLDDKEFAKKILQEGQHCTSGNKVKKMCNMLDTSFRDAIIEDLSHFCLKDLLAKLIPRGPGKARSAGRESAKKFNPDFKEIHTFC